MVTKQKKLMVEFDIEYDFRNLVSEEKRRRVSIDMAKSFNNGLHFIRKGGDSFSIRWEDLKPMAEVIKKAMKDYKELIK